ncbi:hypothetical protein [Cupriavidus taiwanensis]|uniref:hypothetical protein n=1 Tax=Cupriavidus taiwanensis TaxID=164546 RepID=UPI000E1A9C38|nr:hypothetical protein [Cupriavidus taiwanensis]SPC18466.1 hypothetical protein CT19431_MP30391 [Cupriavidus taiwanensis]
MAGKRQHYIPRFLQRGFLAERTGDAERTWLHRRGTTARLVGIRDVGVGEFFYSKLPDAGENALDDLITSLECDIHTDLQGLQQAPRGDVVDSRIPARITTHLTLRTAHVRSIFQQGAAQLLDQISALTTDSDQLRELIGLDSVGMRPILDAIDEELKSSPLGGLLPRPFARRVTAFLLRESFNEVWAFQMPMVVETIAKLIKVLPTMARDGHNNALRTAKTTQWEANLAQLSWRTYSVVGAILPDCIALAQSGADPLTPLTLREHQIPDTIILPIAHDLLLVGSRGEPIEFEIDKINAASAACSDSFFIACSSYDSADLASLIGQRCSLAIKDAVAEAIAEARPCDSSQPSRAPDIALLASANHASSFSFSLACQGFADAETVTKLGEVMQIVVREMSLDLPLSQLDGVTFAADYAAALENLDRGDPTLQADKTRPRIYGQAIAKCVHVIRHGKRKEHLVLNAGIARGLLDAGDENRAWALHVIVGMLANVAHSALYEQRLLAMSEIPFDIVSRRLHTASSACPGRYFAAQTSAFADINAGERFATLCLDSLSSAQQEIRSAKQAYLVDQAMDQLLDVALLHVSSVLDHAAEWLGHRDGLPAQESFPGSSLPDKLKVQGLCDWLELFGRDLRRLYDTDDQFTTENILALSRHVERLLWTMGMFPWPTEDGCLYVSLGPIT